MNVSRPKTSRVVIALDPANERDFAVELAGNLALTATPELLGLFVENARLLEHAGSRLAREIMLTGRERPLDRAVLERQLRAQALQARASFEAAASRLGLSHTFEVTRGDLLAEMLQRSVDAEALVVSLARQARGTGAWLGTALRQLFETRLPLVLLAREGWLSGRSIVVLVEDIANIEPVLGMAAHLARHSGSPITALLTESATGERSRLGERITSTLRMRGIERSEIMSFEKCDARNIVQAARACRARLLVLPFTAPRSESGLIDELLRRLPSALMLVRQ